jgi:hypothetical protein
LTILETSKALERHSNAKITAKLPRKESTPAKAFRPESQKTPRKEMQLALKRMEEV